MVNYFILNFFFNSGEKGKADFIAQAFVKEDGSYAYE